MDISRLEGIIRSGRARDGYAILLTSDHLYWNPPGKPDNNDAEFVLYENREIAGTLTWNPRAGAGTTKGREMAVGIRGRYRAHRREYPAPGIGIHKVQVPVAPRETSREVTVRRGGMGQVPGRMEA